jgi:glycerol uptake facilitator-like aquaporin
VTETATGSARALTAVFIGTFALIFIGVGVAIALGINHDPPVAFAHGLTILVFVAVFGDISGGHFNPAFTVSPATAGCFQGVSLRLTSRPTRWWHRRRLGNPSGVWRARQQSWREHASASVRH